MFGSDYIFTNYPDSKEGMTELLKYYDFDDESIEEYMTSIDETSGAYCIRLSLKQALNVAKTDEPHLMKRIMPPIGYSVVVMNLADLTPEEELAVAAHEFGHAYCGHKTTAENVLQCELEADWFAVVSVGAVHIYNALIKTTKKFNIEDNEILSKRLEVLRQYL